MRFVTAREMTVVLAWSVAIMALTTIPYSLAERWAPTGKQFCGFIWGVDDGNVYLSWIRQAAEGRVLLANQYTIKDQSPHFLNLFLYVLGRVCGVTGITPLAAFHGARMACGVFCLVSIYLLAARMSDRRGVRAWALIFASLSSGLGWLVVLAGQGGQILPGLVAFPMDVADGWQAQPEAIIFSSLLLNPLFAFSLGVVALTILAAAGLCEGQGLRSALGVGASLLLLGNVHGYDIFPLHFTLLAWLLCCAATGRCSWRRAAQQYGAILAVSAASPVWGLYASHADPSYAAKVNTPTLSPRPFDVALGYGLVLALAAAGTWVVARQAAASVSRLRTLAGVTCGLGVVGLVLQQMGAPMGVLALCVWPLPLLAVGLLVICRDAAPGAWRALLPVLWAACGAAVLYLPVPFQRKMIEGLHIALCLLGAFALGALADRAASRGSRLSYPTRLGLAAGLVIAAMPSNVVFVTECLRHVRADNRTLLHVLAPPVFLSRDELAAMQWLAGHTRLEDVVLSSSLTGSHIPAHAPCRVVVGHWAETLRFADYVNLVRDFYAPQASVIERRSVLSLTGATHVFWGPQERLLQSLGGASPTDPSTGLPELQVAYRNAGVSIFAVRSGERGSEHESR